MPPKRKPESNIRDSSSKKPVPQTTTVDLTPPSAFESLDTPTLRTVPAVSAPAINIYEYEVYFTHSSCRDGKEETIRVGIFPTIDKARDAADAKMDEPELCGFYHTHEELEEEVGSECAYGTYSEDEDSDEDSDEEPEEVEQSVEIVEKVKVTGPTVPAAAVRPRYTYEYEVWLERDDCRAGAETSSLGVYSSAKDANAAAKEGFKWEGYQGYTKDKKNGLIEISGTFDEEYAVGDIRIWITKKKKKIEVPYCWVVMEKGQPLGVSRTPGGAEEKLRSRIQHLNYWRKLWENFALGNYKTVRLRFTKDKGWGTVREEIIRIKRAVLDD